MENDKGFLVPISYEGKWKKNEECVWVYDALQTSYVKIYSCTTFAGLLELICSTCEIDRVCNVIQLTSWNCYPSKQIMPPFKIRNDADVSYFIELNGRRDMTTPICITSEKSIVPDPAERKRKKIVSDPTVDFQQNHALTCVKSESVDQQHNPRKVVEVVFQPGLDDSKLADEDWIDDELSSNDEFDYDDAFEFEPDYDDAFEFKPDYNVAAAEPDYDAIFEPDCDVAADYDPYFHVYVGSRNKTSSNNVDEPAAHSSPPKYLCNGNDNSSLNPERIVPADAVASTVESTNVHAFEDFMNGELQRDGTYTVGDFMTRKEELHVVKPSTSVDEALEALVVKRITGFPVVDDEWNLVGVISDYDLLALDSISGGCSSDTNVFPDVDSSWKTFNEIQTLLGKTTGKVVGDLMTVAPLVVRENTNLEDAVRILLETKYRRLPVVDSDGKLVGIITRGNVVRAAIKIKRASEN